MYHSSLLAQRLKGNTVNINVLKLCGWELHDFLAQNKERLTFHALYSHHFYQLILYVAKEKGTSLIFLQTIATMGMNIFSTLPKMIIKEPSSMKRNSRLFSHIQMIPLEPFALFLYIFSLPLNLRAKLLFSPLSFSPSWIPTFSFGFPHHPDKLSSACLSPVTQLLSRGSWPGPYNRIYISVGHVILFNNC